MYSNIISHHIIGITISTHVHPYMDIGDFRDFFFLFEPEGNFYFFPPLKVMPSFDPRPSAKSTAGDGSMEEKGPRRM